MSRLLTRRSECRGCIYPINADLKLVLTTVGGLHVIGLIDVTGLTFSRVKKDNLIFCTGSQANTILASDRPRGQVTLAWSEKMFGIIISGRPVDAAPQQITEAQYAFRIQPNPAFSHIVVFMLPGMQLPPDTAATVYVQIPPSPEFKLLGGIGTGKESAIFKVSGVKQGASNSGGDGDMMTDDPSAPSGGNPAAVTGEIVVGVSIEPAAQVEQQLASLQGVQTDPNTAMVRRNAVSGNPVSTKVLAQRIIGNAFNFLASFGSDTVPLKAFQDWWTKFEKKIELDPSFLEREG